MAQKKSMSSVKKTAATSSEVVAADTKKAYKPDDYILCRSLVSGGLYIVGERSKTLYTFADFGDEVEIEYQDLLYMIRSHDKAIYEPRIVIMDDDLVSQYAEVQRVYDALYTIDDLRDIVKLDARQMESVINKLPSGAIESLKGVVSTMIDNHSLDSVTKIKALDRILGTNLLLGLVQN